MLETMKNGLFAIISNKNIQITILLVIIVVMGYYYNEERNKQAEYPKVTILDISDVVPAYIPELEQVAFLDRKSSNVRILLSKDLTHYVHLMKENDIQAKYKSDIQNIKRK